MSGSSEPQRLIEPELLGRWMVERWYIWQMRLLNARNLAKISNLTRREQHIMAVEGLCSLCGVGGAHRTGAKPYSANFACLKPPACATGTKCRRRGLRADGAPVPKRSVTLEPLSQQAQDTSWPSAALRPGQAE